MNAFSIVVLLITGGCVGTIRDDLGTPHDAHYVAKQACEIARVPFFIPFVPIAWLGFALEAVPENGPIDFAGKITDARGRPLENVSLRVLQAKLVSFDLSDDHPVFSESRSAVRIDGRFDIELPDVHTVKLRFSKPGFRPVEYHLEYVQTGGLRLGPWATEEVRNEGIHWDTPAKEATVIYGQGGLHRTGVQVVMHRRSGSTPHN